MLKNGLWGQRNAAELADLRQLTGLLFETEGVGVWDCIVANGNILSPDCAWTFSNGYRRFMGYETERDFPNAISAVQERFHPDDAERVFGALAGFASGAPGHKRFQEDFRLKHRDGSYVWVRSSANCLRDASGKPLRVTGTQIHIQEIKKAEEERELRAKAEAERTGSLEALMRAMEAGFDRLSAGDLTARLNQMVAPEFEPICRNFNASVESLEDTIGSVVTAVGTMRVGLGEITAAAGDLSQRTEQQAASLEETVAALAEVVKGVDSTARSADDARAAASVAQKEAEKGGDIVLQAIAAMAEIEKSSARIGNIISVIDEIAFQTNLLALNAGVEAARAGEAGRGFAVVAQEVRGLAQRSAEAAKEIKDLISTSSAQVASGVELVSASGGSLQQIVSQVGGVATVISQMASSAREQAISLKEVATAADQMNSVTQQNAAMVEETTTGAQTLSAETEELAALVDNFRTASTARARSNVPAQTLRKAPSAPSRSVPQMRSVGRGGAAAKPAQAQDEWSEF